MAVMTAAAALMSLMVMLVVMVTAAAAPMLLMMMVLFMSLLELCQLRSQGGLAVHGTEQLLTGQCIPGGGNDGGTGIVLSQQFHSGIQLGLGNGIRPGENNGRSGLHLVVVELAKVLHIDLHLARVHDGHGIAQGHLGTGDFVHGTDHIGQLAHTGRLNEDPVGLILVNHLLQSLAEITHQGAADAAGVHFRDVDARVLQKAAVDADLAELILDQNQLLALVAFSDHFLDQGSLAGTQEAGININLCHG